VTHDKIEHLGAGAIAGFTGAFLAFSLGEPLWAGALIAAVIAGALKEFWDMWGHGEPDVWDFVATVVGGLPVAALGALF
jgi:hypothetical protein